MIITTLARNCDVLSDYKYIYLFFGLMSLALTIFLGVKQGGAQSWLGIGFIYVQTSEFVKLLLVLFLAAFFSENYRLFNAGTKIFAGI